VPQDICFGFIWQNMMEQQAEIPFLKIYVYVSTLRQRHAVGLGLGPGEGSAVACI
jgi:hypothetical protein